MSNISSDLVFNIFKQVLLTTLAEELSNHQEYHLYVDILEIENIYMHLVSKSDDEIAYILNSSFNKIYAKLKVDDKIKTYISECAKEIISIFIQGIKSDNLEIIVGTKGEQVGV